MKKLMLIIGIVLLTISTQAKEFTLQYFVTSTDTVYCSKIKSGVKKLRCVLPTGEKLVVNKSDVVLYKIQDKLMQRMPIDECGMETDFMQLVDCEEGLFIYKYEFYNTITEVLDVKVYFFERNCCLEWVSNPTVDEIYAIVNETLCQR